MMRFWNGFNNGSAGNFGSMGAGLAIMIVICVIVLAALAFCMVVCIRYLQSTHKKPAVPGQYPANLPGAAKPANAQVSPTAFGAMNILNERYARGEIGEEEYNKKKADIGRP